MTRRRLSAGRSRLSVLAFGLLDLGVVGSVALGLAARHVHPDESWLPQLAAMGLPAAALAALPLAGVWARRARRGAPWAWAGCALHLGLALTVAARYGPPWPAPPRGDAPELRVLSLNAGVPGPFAAAQMHAELDADPDLVVMQESVLFIVEAESGETAVAGTPAALAVAASPLRADLDLSEDGSFRGQMPVFAREPRGLSEPVVLDPDPDDLSGTAVRAVVRWQGLDVAVYNVHLRSFGPERPWTTERPWSRTSVRAALTNFRDAVRHRAAEAARLRAVLDAEPLPYLVIGDFNSTPQQWPYRHLAEGHAEAMRQAGWARATYPSALPLVTIDGVLGGPGWVATRARVGRDGLSDHRAVHARMRWTGALPSAVQDAVPLPPQPGRAE